MEENNPVLPQQPVIEPQPLKKPFFSKTILAVFVVAIVLILLPAGTYLFLNSNKQVACTTEAKICPDGSSVGRTGPKCEFAKCPKTKPTPTPDPTANWKTYSSSSFGVTFKYPDYFYIKSQDGNSVKFGNSNFGPAKTVLTISKTFTDQPSFIKEDACTIDAMPCFVEKPDVTISGIPGKTFDEIADPSGFRFIQFNNPKLEISITYGGTDPHHISDTILSTFKFTDQTSQVDTSTWKTYNATYDSFTLKYPPILNILEDKYNDKTFRTFLQNKDVQIVIYPGAFSGESSLEAYRRNLETTGASQFTDYNISGEKALKYNITAKNENAIQIITIHNGKAYQMSASPSNSKEIKYLDQILSTFKFTL